MHFFFMRFIYISTIISNIIWLYSQDISTKINLHLCIQILCFKNINYFHFQNLPKLSEISLLYELGRWLKLLKIISYCLFQLTNYDTCSKSCPLSSLIFFSEIMTSCAANLCFPIPRKVFFKVFDDISYDLLVSAYVSTRINIIICWICNQFIIICSIFDVLYHGILY